MKPLATFQRFEMAGNRRLATNSFACLGHQTLTNWICHKFSRRVDKIVGKFLTPFCFPFRNILYANQQFTFLYFLFLNQYINPFSASIRFPFERISIKVDRFSYSRGKFTLGNWREREREKESRIHRPEAGGGEALDFFGFNRVYSVIRPGR